MKISLDKSLIPLAKIQRGKTVKLQSRHQHGSSYCFPSQKKFWDDNQFAQKHKGGRKRFRSLG